MMRVSVLTEKKKHNVNKNCNFLKKNNKMSFIDLFFHNVKCSQLFSRDKSHVEQIQHHKRPNKTKQNINKKIVQVIKPLIQHTEYSSRYQTNNAYQTNNMRFNTK